MSDLERADPKARSLVGANDPPAVSIFNTDGAARLVLVADHAGRAFPAAMRRLGLDSWVLGRHVAWDIGTDQLVRALAVRLDATAIIANYSRLLVDTNRSPGDPSLIPATSDGIEVPGNQGLTSADREARLQTFYYPYRRAIEDALDRFRSRGIAPALVAIHSFTPEMAGVPRPWHAGVLWDKDPRIAQPLLQRLRAHVDLQIGDNQPYSGRHPADYTIDHHGEAARLPHVSIEVRQDLIESDDGAARWSAVLGDALADILADETLYRELGVGG